MAAAARSILRGLPLFISARPRTPLRVLCIMAFDTIHRHLQRRPIPMRDVRALAALLDLGAAANAAFDEKPGSQTEFRATLRLLEEAGIRSSVADYLRRLTQLERTRPLPGGDARQFRRVQSYREAVVRLSLGMVSMTGKVSPSLDAGIRATCESQDRNLLFRMVMQCQIIDDVMDYPADVSAGLPSFLTASRSLPEAFELTRRSADDYAREDKAGAGEVLSLRMALFLVSACTRFVLVLGRWRFR